MTDATLPDAFVRELERLVTLDDRGALAVLRSAADPTSPQYSIACRYLTPWFNNQWDEPRIRLLAELAARWHRGRVWTTSTDPNMGSHVRDLADSKNEDIRQGGSATRRFERLITSHLDDLPVHLRSICSLLRANDIPINWSRLSKDLRDWDHPTRFVQNNWSRQYFRVRSEGGDTT